jgi:hypothetical protein
MIPDLGCVLGLRNPYSSLLFCVLIVTKSTWVRLESKSCFQGGYMSNLDNVLRQLRDERGRAQQQLDQLDSAISVLEGLGGTSSSGRVSQAGRVVSVIARRRMAAAQRARWAKYRLGSGKAAKRPRAVREISAEGRRRIAAAQKARWAKFRAERKVAAAA